MNIFWFNTHRVSLHLVYGEGADRHRDSSSRISNKSRFLFLLTRGLHVQTGPNDESGPATVILSAGEIKCRFEDSVGFMDTGQRSQVQLSLRLSRVSVETEYTREHEACFL